MSSAKSASLVEHAVLCSDADAAQAPRSVAWVYASAMLKMRRCTGCRLTYVAEGEITGRTKSDRAIGLEGH